MIEILRRSAKTSKAGRQRQDSGQDKIKKVGSTTLVCKNASTASHVLWTTAC